MDIKEYYRLAKIEDNHWWYRSVRGLVIDEINKGWTFGGSRSNLKIPVILDAGCGTGGLTEKLAKFGFTVGIDISDLALGLKPHLQAKYINGSINSLPLADKSFDLITCISVLYHRQVSDSKAASELFRTLKSGGRGIFIMPAFQWAFSSHDEAVHTARRYTLLSARKLFERNGFKIQNSKYIFSFLYPAFIVKRFLEKSGLVKRPVSDLANLPRWLNKALLTICDWEWKLTRRFNFPFGSSLYIVVEKP